MKDNPRPPLRSQPALVRRLLFFDLFDGDDPGVLRHLDCEATLPAAKDWSAYSLFVRSLMTGCKKLKGHEDQWRVRSVTGG
ncbi:MAG TPA: hypothetical protein VKG25_16425 [Bryobacteraceae bacterium]|nr:hypothetical protein [Bryobacteraceae bacterium]